MLAIQNGAPLLGPEGLSAHHPDEGDRSTEERSSAFDLPEYECCGAQGSHSNDSPLYIAYMFYSRTTG